MRHGNKPFAQRIVALTGKMQSLYARLSRLLLLEHWFPHLPIALAVALLGVLRFLPPLQRLQAVPLFTAKFDQVRVDLLHLGIRGVPTAAVAVFLIVMSVGLLFRSRLAWVITVFITATSLVLLLTPPHGGAHSVLIAYHGTLLAVLLLSIWHFNRSSIAASTLFALTSLIISAGYAVFGSYLLGDNFRPPVNDFFSAVYFAIITMSTTGYGDVVPVTLEGKMFVVSVIVLGISVFATTLSAIVVPVINGRIERLTRRRQGKMKRFDHYIIVGFTALANNTYQELNARQLPVTFIVRRRPETGLPKDADVVVGDGSDLETLRTAGGERAKAILALCNDDSENAFVVLAAKELGGDAKTVAVVNDGQNLQRIRRVHPDIVIAPPVLGGELLAMALSGEEVDPHKFVRRLLVLRH